MAQKNDSNHKSLRNTSKGYAVSNLIPESTIVEYRAWLKANNYVIDDKKFEELAKEESYINLAVLKEIALKCLL